MKVSGSVDKERDHYANLQEFSVPSSVSVYFKGMIGLVRYLSKYRHFVRWTITLKSLFTSQNVDVSITSGPENSCLPNHFRFHVTLIDNDKR